MIPMLESLVPTLVANERSSDHSRYMSLKYTVRPQSLRCFMYHKISVVYSPIHSQSDVLSLLEDKITASFSLKPPEPKTQVKPFSFYVNCPRNFVIVSEC